MRQRRKGLLLVSIVCCMFMMAMPVSAASKNTKGAQLPNYSKIVELTVDKGNFDRSFRSILKEAKEKATNKIQYKIVIPKGTHKSNWSVRIPSNTWVYAKGATINAGSIQFFTTDQMGKTRNILIEGGTWTTTKQAKNTASESALFRAVGTTNMIFKDMIIKSNRKNHVIEVGDMNGFTVENCRIDAGGGTPSGVQCKEAIQLDIATSSAMPSYPSSGGNRKLLNGKGCHNVLIKNTRFNNCQRGVGSHSGTPKGAEKTPYTNIVVQGCTFKNLKGEAIFGQNWRNATIVSNSITTCRRAGIYLHDAFSVLVTSNTIKDIKRFTGAKRSTYGSNATGVFMVKTTWSKVRKNTVSGYSGKIVIQSSCRKNTISGNKASKKR